MDDDKKHKDQFNASLQLPGDPSSNQDDSNPAADLIRKKVEAAYGHEPDVEEEAEDMDNSGKRLHRSKHQEFIYNLTSSGRPLHEIQTAWHEFYNTQAEAAHHPVMTHAEPGPKPTIRLSAARKAGVKAKAKLAETRAKTSPKMATRRTNAHNPLHSILFGLGTGSVVILIFMFSFFNERIIAPFIQPSRNATNTPIISDSAVSNDPEVIIPKINVEIPVIYDVNTIDETAVEKGLERGVVHYADTAVPGQNGNVVIVGHSSNNILNPGKYKFAFTLLHDLQAGDTFYLQKDGKRYTYQVYKRTIVKPDDVSVLGLADKPATATLITCDPPGTSNNRLVVTAQQISPDPVTNTLAAPEANLATSTAIIPGNSPSLWSRLTNWFKQ